MRLNLVLVLLVPALASAVSDSSLQLITTLPDERPVVSNALVEPVQGNGSPGTSVVLVGTVDTIGGTTYDWQANGPSLRMLVNSPDYGLHAAWMYSTATQTTYPDRNMRYNFYDYTIRRWNWIDPNHMSSGVNVFTDRCGYGTLDADPATGVAVVSCHTGTTLHPEVARDMAPGAGIFEYCSGSDSASGYKWPPISVGQTGKIHCALVDDATGDYLYYSKVGPWCTWATPIGMAAPQPDPVFPDQAVAASKVSDKVCATWEYDEGDPDPGFYRTSTDGGATWGSPTVLPWPLAYGGDTATSYHITSLYPFFDRQDKLHIVAGVMPYVSGQAYIIPAQIWHWSPDNTPNWSLVRWAGCDPNNLLAPIGYNATYACRPSIGEDNNDNLFVAWEEFDSSNVEVGPPELLRADIFVAGSDNNGRDWGTAVKLTGGGSVSHRFPSIVDLAINGTGCDTVCVLYEIDQHAGFALYSEGPHTNNPIVVHKIPVDSIPGSETIRGSIIYPSAGAYLAGGDTVEIVWTINPKEFFFGALLLSTDGGGSFPDTIAPYVATNETTHTWALPHYSSSRCRVKFEAFDSSGSLVFNMSTGNFTIDSDIPAAPQLLAPPDSSSTRNPAATLRWHRVPDTSPINYTIRIAYDPNLQVLVDSAVRPDTYYSRVLSVDTTYYWGVLATDRCGHAGPMSEIWEFLLDRQSPSAPVLIYPRDSAEISSDTVNLIWHASDDNLSGIDVYHVQLARDDTLFIDTIPVPVTSDTSVLCNLDPAPAYFWHVRAKDRAGNWSEWSPRWTFAPPVGTGGWSRHLPQVPTLVECGPSPFVRSTQFLLQLPEPAKVTAAIYDATGQKITTLTQGLLARGEHNLAWNGNTTAGTRTAPGIYYLRVLAADTRHVRRLVLAR